MLEDKVAYIHTYIHPYVCTYISDCSKKLKSKDSKTLPLSTCAVGFEASAQAKLCCGAHSGRGFKTNSLTYKHTYVYMYIGGWARRVEKKCQRRISQRANVASSLGIVLLTDIFIYFLYVCRYVGIFGLCASHHIGKECRWWNRFERKLHAN